MTPIGTAAPRWSDTHLRFHRTLAEAFPADRALSISGPYRRSNRLSAGVLAAVTAIAAAAYILMP